MMPLMSQLPKPSLATVGQSLQHEDLRGMVAVVSGDVDRQVEEPVGVVRPDGRQQAGLGKRAETTHQAVVRGQQFRPRVRPPACGRGHGPPV